ncbi:hypothetical protein GCM10010267_23630 [Streptomyces griseorubens]|nr:hypothetical protein GCM10010267_23630 [Streptomyces griseorubens]
MPQLRGGLTDTQGSYEAPATSEWPGLFVMRGRRTCGATGTTVGTETTEGRNPFGFRPSAISSGDRI